ncbi:DUF159 family protein [Amylibacter marinus]|uniref:Abasic site processing protein n=1 Tax=Amylibacter marinus TaxID=1475483 RepID=A0ABQ5VVN9_9RHOB|nr:SOS response-associated peptidase [Amylibacter marinus]GLQ35234.1 DUF159 family protein [Amylibacter marinus]
MCGALIAGEMTWAEMMAIMRGFLGPAINVDDTAPPADTGYNIRPTQQLPMVALINDALVLSTARWWMVPNGYQNDWSDWKPTTFNARIETAHKKKVFAQSWRHHRCAIPVQGYYEWTGQSGAKQPWFIAPKSNEPQFYFAGLYSTRGDGLHSCTVLTRAALSDIAHIHARTPVMLSGQELQPWLRREARQAGEIAKLGMGFEHRMRFHKVRPIKSADDGPELIEPYDPPEQLGFAL